MNTAPSRLQGLARQWLPLALRTLGNRLSGNLLRFTGDYSGWEEAARHGRYDAASILQSAAAAADAADRRGLTERDGSLVVDGGPPGALVSALLLAARAGKEPLRVLDFGGALGTHWRATRLWQAALPPLHWQIVEQPGYVAEGRRRYTDQPRFHAGLDEALQAGPPDLLIASSVIQYLPEPWTHLDALMACKAPVLLIDRTPLTTLPTDRLTLQTTPRVWGAHRYPMWLLPESALRARIAAHYRIVQEFDALDAPFRWQGAPVRYRGLIALRREGSAPSRPATS